MAEDSYSIDDAAAFVEAMDNPAPEPAKEAKAPEAKEPAKPAPAGDDEGVDTGEDEDLPDDDSDAAADDLEDGEDGEEDSEEQPLAEAPPWWDAEAKKHFASLTPEAQQVVRAQEDKREAVVQKAKDEAKQASTAALAVVENAKGLADRLAAVLPDQRAEFDAYYDDIDWPEYSRQNPAAAQEDWFKYQQGLKYFDDAETAKAEAEKLERETFIRTQTERLAEIAPELAGKPELLKALGDYLPSTGIEAAALQHASAEELVILNKARLYDALMAKAAAKPTPPRQKEPTAPAKVPPQGQARTPQSSKQRDVQRLANRLNQTRSRDDAAEYIGKLGY